MCTHFFLARVLVNELDHLQHTFVLSGLYYILTQPPLDYGLFVVPCLLVTFAAAGVGYFISTLVPPQHGPFFVSIYIFVSCGLLGHPLKVGIMEETVELEFLMDFTSITRWSVGMSSLKAVEVLSPVPKSIRRLAELQMLDETYMIAPRLQEPFGYWYTGVLFLLGMGVAFRVAACLALRFTHRDKQV